MNRRLVIINESLQMFGIRPLQTIRALKGIPYFFKNLRLLKKQKKFTVREFPFGQFYPCLDDRFSNSGSTKGHYFHQDLLVARRIHFNNPDIHIDIGSRIDGFVAHVASFRLIKVLDIRPLTSEIPNMEFQQVDLMAVVKGDMVECCDSLSCLHAMEHFGLGRYGDTVNYDGYIPGLDNLYRILKKGGKLYFSVPIGPQRIEFDAHRVFSIGYLLELFIDKYQIDNFSYVDDRGDLHENVPIAETSIQDNFGCIYGCGIFEMTKL
jgi:hypothetical protein